MGMREPIFMVAFCESVQRMRGFCRILVFESLSSRLAVAEPTVTAKSVALRWARSYRVGPLVVVVVFPVVLFELLFVFGWIATPTLVGQEIPMFFSQFLLTSRTAMSTITSGRALSRSLTSFC